jgi:hypothetical protein
VRKELLRGTIPYLQMNQAISLVHLVLERISQRASAVKKL